tara:strand:- start:2037 stop:2447 length:411 start_codon:yes stop_codon:yes gene_type:complete
MERNWYYSKASPATQDEEEVGPYDSEAEALAAAESDKSLSTDGSLYSTPYEKGEHDEDLLFADGFEDAFIGLSRRFGIDRPVATYDYDKCIEVLMRSNMSREGAMEFFEYNVIGAWVGELTPIFLHKHTLQEVLEE